ncbi:MAG: transposase [Lentisphaeraceae bacterium]|nr:transposase [Lentisphaeraceae bacterium]
MKDEFKNTQNWYRRQLPHYDASDKIQFITYRLADSLPQKVLINIKEFCEKENSSDNAINLKYKTLIEKYLDSGYGSCALKEDSNARIIIENWRHFHKKSYDLLAYVVMPNHVHLLIKTYEDFPLSKIIHSWKSFTAHKIFTKESGHLWQREYWDRFIRNEKHYWKAVDYIISNPRKAGLVKNDIDWPYSSIHGI